MPSSAAPPAGVPAEEVARFLEQRTGAPVRRIDTHAAIVFLTEDRAWKLKRAVHYGYLDFSTPARRKAVLDEELRLNRRTAPGLYLAVHRLTRDAAGALTLDGGGEAIDYLLEMHRFADDALLDDVARRGGMDEPLLLRLAEAIQGFHADAEVAFGKDGAERLRAVVRGNAASFAAYPGPFDPKAVEDLQLQHAALLDRHADLLDARAAAGRVRHCHGDLHLANIALVDGAPLLFDCLEFDRELATTDVLYDLAFLLMDLWHRGLRGEANRLFNRYLDLSGRDEAGVALMPLFLSIRAAIRAHVAAARGAATGKVEDESAARDYLRLACELLAPVPSLLLAIGGRSGTGKSTLARVLGGDIGVAPGARVLRSDVLRKRLAGLPPEARIPASQYTPEASARVYAALDMEAAALLAAGASVIADAAFLTGAERDGVEGTARRAGVRFAGLWLEASERVRGERVGGRVRDASDADARVVRLQSQRPVGDLAGWRRLRAGGEPAEVAAAARLALGL